MICANICFGGKEKASKKDLKYYKLSPSVFINVFLVFFSREHVKNIFLWWYFFAYSSYSLLEEKLSVFNCRVFGILFFW